MTGVRHTPIPLRTKLFTGDCFPIAGWASDTSFPKADIVAIAQEVSNNLGHNDLHTISAYYGSFRKARPTAWTRAGGFALDDGRIVNVCTDPPLLAEPDGSYRQRSEGERAEIAISIQIEGLRGVEATLDLGAFVQAHPGKEAVLLELLKAKGLSDTAEYSSRGGRRAQRLKSS
jgi:hypothetical protein